MSALFRLFVAGAVLFTSGAFGAIESGEKELEISLEAINNGLITTDNRDQARKVSEDQYQRAVAIYDGNDYELLLAVQLYSIVVQKTANYRDAKLELQRVVTELEARFGSNAYSLVYALTALGELQAGAEQVATFQRALQIQSDVYPDKIENYAGYARRMAMAYTYNSEQFGQALQMLGVALPVFEVLSGKDSLEAMYLHLAYGRAYSGFKATELANTSNERAIAIAEGLDNDEVLAEAWFIAGNSLSLIPGNQDATVYLDNALSRFGTTFGEEHLRTGFVRLDVARHAIGSGSPGRAIEQLQRALRIFQMETDSSWEKESLKLLVEAYEDLGQRDEATKYCLAISRLVPWVDDQNYQPILKRAPEFPATAVANGQGGYVVVEYTVDENGFVQSPRIIESEGPESLHDVSIAASYKFRYAPRLINDVPVATEGVRNKFSFKLLN